MKRIMVRTEVLAVGCAALLSVAVVGAGERPLSIRAVMHKQYTVTRAPFVAIKKELALPGPDWAKTREATGRFVALAVALEKNEPTWGAKSSWKTFVAAHLADARAMEHAAEAHDRAAIVAAHRRLAAACAACHKAHRFRGP